MPACISVAYMCIYRYSCVSLRWKLGTSTLYSICTTCQRTGMIQHAQRWTVYILCFEMCSHYGYMQISISQAEESLKVFVEVLQSSINSTQRLNLLMSAYLEQRSTSEITVTFVKVYSIYKPKFSLKLCQSRALCTTAVCVCTLVNVCTCR